MSKKKLKELQQRMTDIIKEMGYPPELGLVLSSYLGTEKAMMKMIGYLLHGSPRSAEEIADEAVAISDDRTFWQEKKCAEFYQGKYNQMLWDEKNR